MDDIANPATPTSGHGSGDFDGEYTRIEVESFETTDKGGYGQSPRFLLPKPPFWSTWICLLLAWFFLASPIPFTVFIGLPLNLAALVLAMISLGRGGIKTGILVMILGTIGSAIAYLTGWLNLLGDAISVGV